MTAVDRSTRTPASAHSRHQQVDNLLRRAVAEELAQRLFVIRDAVPLHEPDEIRGRVARQRRFREVGIGREEIVGPRVQVGEVAAASAGDQDLLARPLRALQHRDTASAAARFDRGHQARGAGAEDEDIEILPSHDFNYYGISCPSDTIDPPWPVSIRTDSSA